MEDPIQIEKLFKKLEVINKATQRPIDLKKVAKAIEYLHQSYSKPEQSSLGSSDTPRSLEVAYMAVDYYPETELIVTALLHDLVKHTVINLETIRQEFGEMIAQKLARLTNLHIDHDFSTMATVKQMQEENATDLLIIKLLNNVYEMQHVGLKTMKRQKEAALRSLKNFLPIAIYLELQEIEQALLESYQPILYPKRSTKTSAFSADFGLSTLEI
jgi:(p)ppGpp synthase/HD superfamily hydrolase